LSILAGIGLEVYRLIPDYRDECPICTGRDCAARHGLYHRAVQDESGAVYVDFPVPRFRCQRKGPIKDGDVTFSVLPAAIAPRRRWCVALMTWVVGLVTGAGGSVCQAVAGLAKLPWDVAVEPVTVYRVVDLFASLYDRLRSFSVAGVEVRSVGDGVRGKAAEAMNALTRAGPGGSGTRLAVKFHESHFPRLLFDLSSS
jgi:hypothetical protein